MNLAHEPTPHDVFLNVRKAYRLLHDYQYMIRDGVSYISGQFEIGFTDCFPLMKGTGLDRTKLLKSPWDFLPMISCEFRFQNYLENEESLILSLLVISDTALKEVEDKETISRIAPADQASTKFAFIMRKTQLGTPLEMRLCKEDTILMINFIKESGGLPDELAKAGYVGKCYDMSCLTSEFEANKVVSAILECAKQRSWPLFERKKK